MRLAERACRKIADFFTRLFSVLLKTSGNHSRFGWIPRRHIMYRLKTLDGFHPATQHLIRSSRGRDPPQAIPHSFISLPALLRAGSLQW